MVATSSVERRKDQSLLWVSLLFRSRRSSDNYGAPNHPELHGRLTHNAHLCTRVWRGSKTQANHQTWHSQSEGFPSHAVEINCLSLLLYPARRAIWVCFAIRWLNSSGSDLIWAQRELHPSQAAEPDSARSVWMPRARDETIRSAVLGPDRPVPPGQTVWTVLAACLPARLCGRKSLALGE